MSYLTASQSSMSERSDISEMSNMTESSQTTDQSIEEVPEWAYIYNCHPGWIKFSDKYQDHIMFINNMIEDYCYKYSVPIYQFGNSTNLHNLIVESHPNLIKRLMSEAEFEFNQSLEEEEEEDEDEWKVV